MDLDATQIQHAIDVVLALIPADWAKWLAPLGAAGVFVGALRTLLRTAVAVLYAIDFTLDGHYDWQWVGRFGDFLDRVDAALADSRWVPVKALFLRGRK